MTLSNHTSLGKSQQLGRVALTALVIGLGGAASVTLPLGNLAWAGNGNGNGGGHGHDGGHGGGKGGGQGNGGGQGASHDASHNGSGSSAKAGKDGVADSDPSDDDSGKATSDDSSTGDGSMAPSKLGKLNGFFHASPNGLANASPNSSIGRISHTFKQAVSDFAAAGETPSDPNDPNATPHSRPSIDDLGAILAGATNKPVTATQVEAIIDRLAEQNPDDESLNDFADSIDDATAQDIADSANAAKSGEPTDESGAGDATDDSAPTTATN